MSNWVIIDTETTGLEPGSRMVEIAVVHVARDGSVVRSFCQLMHPGMPIPADATGIHGIHDDHVKNAASTRDVLASLLDWLPDRVVWIGHSVEFDLNILAWEISRAGFPPLAAAQFIDTVRLADRLAETPNNRLEIITAIHCWKLTSHRAGDDAEAVRRLLCRFLAKRKNYKLPFSEFQPSWSFPTPFLSTQERFWKAICNAEVVTIQGEPIIPLGIADTAKGVELHGWSVEHRHRVMFNTKDVSGADEDRLRQNDQHGSGKSIPVFDPTSTA